MGKLNITTYNSTGLGELQRAFIKDFLEDNDVDILLLQETWLLEEDISRVLSNIDCRYLFTGSSGIPPNTLLHGRPYGGTAILWKKELARQIKPVKTKCNRINGVIVTLSDQQTILILSVYMPTDTRSKLLADHDFEECMDYIDMCIEEHNCTHNIIGGDFNVDLDRQTANLKCYLSSIHRNGLTDMWDHHRCPSDVTFSAPGMLSAGSRIDHVAFSHDLANFITRMDVLDSLKDFGHRPVCVNFDVHVSCPSSVASTADASQMPDKMIAWHKVTEGHLQLYQQKLSHLLETQKELLTAPNCSNMTCKDAEHIQTIEKMCDSLISCCLEAGDETLPKCTKRNPLSPSWNKNVKPYRDDSKFWGALWNDCGRPREGTVCDIYKKTKREYHYAVRRHKNQIKDHRNEKMAEAIITGSQRNLWYELKKMRGKMKLNPPHIDGQSCSKDICTIFHDKYKDLYNSVPSDNDALLNIMQDLQVCAASADPKDFVVEVNTVIDCIKSLKASKRDGDRGLWSDHLIRAPRIFIESICSLFSSMVNHGYTPKALLLSTLIPLIKDRNKDICCSSNFRGIALCSSIAKVFDLYLLKQYSGNLISSNLQFAYKDGHSTTLCTSVMKEVISYYRSQGTAVYCALLDASKAFDRVRFDQMAQLLQSRSIPAPIIRILLDNLTRQRVRTSWKGIKSEEFSCTNGVRQGGIASPVLFAIYFDELLRRLEGCGAGCHIGHHFVGGLAYADDVTLLAPTELGLQIMLEACEIFAKDFSVSFNENKTTCIRFKLPQDRLKNDPNVFFNGSCLKWTDMVTHLGNTLTSDLKDYKDIEKKTSDFIWRVNSIIVNFRSVSTKIKCKLFESQCFFYGCQQWFLSDAKCLERFHVQWRKSVRRLLNLPWHARSAILPHLISRLPFIDQICTRFLKMVSTAHKTNNDMVQYIVQFSHAYKGLFYCNLQYIQERWRCTWEDLMNFKARAVVSENSDGELRAHLIHELSSVLEGNTVLNGFTAAEVSDLRNCIATY